MHEPSLEKNNNIEYVNEIRISKLPSPIFRVSFLCGPQKPALLSSVPAEKSGISGSLSLFLFPDFAYTKYLYVGHATAESRR